MASSGLVELRFSGQSVIEQAQKQLAGIPGGFQKALKTAASRATQYMRANDVKAARERYAISAENAKNAQKVSVKYSYTNGVQASVTFAGKRIPLYRFDGVSPANPTPDTTQRVPVLTSSGWRMVYPSVTAKARVLQAHAPKSLGDAFVLTAKSGHTGIFSRTGGMTRNNRDQLEEYFAPAVPQMLGNTEVAERLEKATMAKFEEQLANAVDRIIGGYGGQK